MHQDPYVHLMLHEARVAELHREAVARRLAREAAGPSRWSRLPGRLLGRLRGLPPASPAPQVASPVRPVVPAGVDRVVVLPDVRSDSVPVQRAVPERERADLG